MTPDLQLGLPLLQRLDRAAVATSSARIASPAAAAADIVVVYATWLRMAAWRSV